MSEQQARTSREDVYDHEQNEPRPGGRRRRPVADWGVGDDVFDHMPRNRFSRAAEGPSRSDRRFRPAADDAPRDAAPAEDRVYGEAAPARDAEDRAPVEAADVPRGRVEDGRKTLKIGKPEDIPSEIEAVTADRDLGEVDVPEAPELRSPPPAERRTVKIGGRPEGSLEAARFQRDRARRPPRTTHERIGARPDRLAMWAVALGILLILIAVLTAL